MSGAQCAPAVQLAAQSVPNANRVCSAAIEAQQKKAVVTFGKNKKVILFLKNKLSYYFFFLRLT